MRTKRMTIKVLKEIEVDVEYITYGATRGTRSSLGVPEEPDEDAHIEINSIKDTDGNEIDMADILDEEEIIHIIEEEVE